MDIATTIARKLLTNGDGQKGIRLAIKLKGEQEGGGWCEKAIIGVIRKVLVPPATDSKQGDNFEGEYYIEYVSSDVVYLRRCR